MWLDVTNAETRVTRATETELAWLDNYLGVPDTKARYRAQAGARRGLLNLFTNTFPTGLLPLVQGDGPGAGFKVEVIDRRRAPCKPDPAADLGWLRDYQEEAVEAGAWHGRGIFHAPTGSGKTEVMVAFGQVYPCRWGVLVASKSLLEQTAKRFEERTGEDVGRIGDGRFDVHRVTVATFQTVHRGLAARDPRVLKWLASLEGLQVDECHLLPAESFWQVAMAASRAYFRFGYSATPFARGDRKGVLAVAALGPTVYRIMPATLVAAGAIARGSVRLVPVQQGGLLSGVYGDAHEALVVRSRVRNAAVLAAVERVRKPALVFVRALEHGRLLERELRARDVPCEFVFGAKHTKEREAAVRRLVHGDTDVLVANVVFQAGVDIPELMSVVNAAGGKSHIAALQQAGRGSRRRDSTGAVVKDSFEVVDFADRGCGCKVSVLVQTDDGRTVRRARWSHKSCEWLERHAAARRRAYLGEGFDVIVSAG